MMQKTRIVVNETQKRVLDRLVETGDSTEAIAQHLGLSRSHTQDSISKLLLQAELRSRNSLVTMVQMGAIEVEVRPNKNKPTRTQTAVKAEDDRDDRPAPIPPLPPNSPERSMLLKNEAVRQVWEGLKERHGAETAERYLAVSARPSRGGYNKQKSRL